jgi:hypothetical protein
MDLYSEVPEGEAEFDTPDYEGNPYEIADDNPEEPIDD